MSRFSYLIAGGLVLGVAGWLASGMLEEEATPVATTRTEVRTPLVEVVQSAGRPVARYVMARGDVLPRRPGAHPVGGPGGGDSR